MFDNNDDRSGLIYVLAGVGLGALIGAICGLLFAPKAGTEIREDLGHKLEDLRNKVQQLSGEVTNKLGQTVGQTVDRAKSAIQKGQDQAEAALQSGQNDNA